MCDKIECVEVNDEYARNAISTIDAIEKVALVCDDFEITIIDDEIKIRVKE